MQHHCVLAKVGSGPEFAGAGRYSLITSCHIRGNTMQYHYEGALDIQVVQVASCNLVSVERTNSHCISFELHQKTQQACKMSSSVVAYSSAMSALGEPSRVVHCWQSLIMRQLLIHTGLAPEGPECFQPERKCIKTDKHRYK